MNMANKKTWKTRLIPLVVMVAILLAFVPSSVINVRAADVSISSVEVTQIMGKGIDLDSGKYYFMNMFVSEKPTAVQVVMADETKIDSATLDIYYEGSLLTTVKSTDKSSRQIITFVPAKSEVGAWKAGRYKFTANINGESKTTEAIFNDSRTFSILLISASVKYQGKVYDAPEIDAGTIPLRAQTLPVSESKLITKYRNAKIGFGTGADGYDISTPEGHMSFLADIEKYRIKSASTYDAVVTVVQSPLGEADGYTNCEHAIVITLNNKTDTEALGATLLHELGHIFGSGDEYTGGSFKINVNGAPYGISGTDNGKSVTGNREYLKHAENNDYSGILIHEVQNPYNPKAHAAMLERSSFMGSSYRHWPTSMVWEEAYRHLVPNSQNVLPRVYTDGSIVAKRPSSNDLTEVEMDDLKRQYRDMLNEVRVAAGYEPYKEDQILASGDKHLREVAEEALRTRNIANLIDLEPMLNSIRADTKHLFTTTVGESCLYEYEATELENMKNFFTSSPCGQWHITNDYMFLAFVRADNVIYYIWSSVSGAYFYDKEAYKPQPETPPIPEVNPVNDEVIDPDDFKINNNNNNTNNINDDGDVIDPDDYINNNGNNINNNNNNNNINDNNNNNVNDNNNSGGNNATDTPAENSGTSTMGVLNGESGLTLLAENADLSKAPDIILESNSRPYNLGSWKADNAVSWKFEVTSSGFYEIWMEYSRQKSDIDAFGTFRIYNDNREKIWEHGFFVNPTSESNGDWSIYDTLDGGYYATNVALDRGVYYLEISPGTSDNAFTDEYFINLRNASFKYVEAMYGAYPDLTKEQRVTLLGYDVFDIGNPWRPVDSDYVYGFFAWYANNQYGLNITAQDARNADAELTEAADYDGMGMHPYAETSRFSLICDYYDLYPSQEMRESMEEWRWMTSDYMPFGENPKRAKNDTDQISADYFNPPENDNGGYNDDADINDPDGEW